MKVDFQFIETIEDQLSPATRERLDLVAERIVTARRRGGRVVVVTGSGPNVHEGVTTLIAELMRLGVVHGVTTSSAVVAHEMGGVLEKVKRVNGRAAGVPPELLPLGDSFELTNMSAQALDALAREMPLDGALLEKLAALPGPTIIKAAGNLSYPMGLRVERLAAPFLQRARCLGLTFESAVGAFADERTMIGRGARMGLPVLVTIPQLIGGGAVGLAIGDSISITERAAQLAGLLGSADVIIESAVALTQEIHDGPFETHTGHGLWAAWDGLPVYSLAGKTLVRMDLDPALEEVWQRQRQGCAVQQAIDQGLPKTKLFKVPFRMEMSGFARLEGSVPLIGDIGLLWPALARRLAGPLDLKFEWMSYPQDTPLGCEMREWIVENIRPITRSVGQVGGSE